MLASRSPTTLLSIFVLVSLAPAGAMGQTDPAPQSLPISQDWGDAPFMSMPSGFAAWNGINGLDVTTQSLAEASVPTGDAVLFTSSPTSGGAGGCYGYANNGNARFAILTSSSGINGANQLALAANTTGQANLVLQYELIPVVNNQRTVGTVCQYRVGSNGPWTTLPGAGNPYIQNIGLSLSPGYARLRLPRVLEERPLVQIRWAVWRGTESGDSSGFAIDNIVLLAMPAGPRHCIPQLVPLDLNGGGNLLAAAGPYSLWGSFAQTGSSDEATGGPYAVCAGFWPIERALVAPGISLDLDDDGDVDIDDLITFVAALVHPEVDAGHVLAADMNCDSEMNGADIQIFVSAFIGAP